MTRAPTVAVLVILALSVVAGAAAGTSSVASPQGSPALATDAPDSGVDVSVTYDLSAGDDGEVGVVLAFDPAADVTALRYRVPSDARVVATDGFGDLEGDRLLWNSRTEDPSIELVVRPRFGAPDPGLFFTLATGEWALLRDRSRTSVRTAGTRGWQGPRTPAVHRRVATAGEGYVGARVVYLGPHEVVTRQVDGTAIRVVVPEGGIAADPQRVLERLAFAERHLGIGATDRDVTVVAGPEPIYHGYVAGSNESAVDLVVSASERARSPDDIWLHEFVHARQDWSLGPDVRWLTEGSANYYAALTNLHLTGNYPAFRSAVRTDQDREAVLAEAGPSFSPARYSKGMRVAAALDAEIRAASGDATFADVLAAMNAHEGEIDYETFVDIVSETAGKDMSGWLDTHVRSSAVPDVSDDPARFAATDDAVDSDADGLIDVAEVERATDPFGPDTDDDGLDDGAEVETGTDPLRADTDGDGLEDGAEVERGSDPLDPDTDDDGLDDGREVDLDGDPTERDTDGDGLDDDREAELATDLDRADSDGDGMDDAAEVEAGTNPLSTDTDGDGVADGPDAAPLDPEQTTPTSGDGPGFGAAGALAAVVLAGGLLSRRRG